MGFFGSKKKTYVASAAMHLIEMTNDSQGNRQDEILAAILQSNVPYLSRKDITGEILKGRINVKTAEHVMEKIYNYAKTDYKLGLPDGATLASNPINPEDIAPYIATDIGYSEEVQVVDYRYEHHTPELNLYDYLVNTRGYDRLTDTITIYPPGTAFTEYYNQSNDTLQKEVRLGIIDINADNISATIHYELFVYRPIRVRTAEEGEHGMYYNSHIEYQWVKDPNEYLDVVPIPGATAATPWGEDCLFAIYYKLDSEGAILPGEYGWIYDIADHTYPALDKAQTTTADEYLPVVPIRYQNIDLTDPATQNTPEDPTNLFSTSKKLLSYLKIDLESLGQRLNKNPDIGDMDNAYVMWGADFQTDYYPTLFYMMEYFYNIYQMQTVGETTFLAAIADPTQKVEPVSTIRLNCFAHSAFKQQPETAFKEYGLALDFEYDYIKENTTTDSIGTGEVGYAEKSIQSYSATVTTTDYDREGEPYTSSQTYTRYKYIIKAQITESLVRTIEVYNPKVNNWVYQNHKVTTTLKEVVASEDEHNMILPLEYNLTESLDPKIKSLLYADCSLMVINSIEIVKLKWYQSGFFKFVIMAVGIILTVMSDGALSWVNGLTTAAEAGGMALIQYLVISAVVLIGSSMILNAAVHWIVQELGAKFAVIAAIILVVAAVTSGKIKLIDDAFEYLMTDAAQILQIANALISSANEFLVEAGQKITNNYESFLDKLSGLWEELEEIQDLTAMKAHLDPITFTSPAQFRLIPDETPSMFFQRTLGLAGNSVFPIHDEIYNFYDTRFNVHNI